MIPFASRPNYSFPSVLPSAKISVNRSTKKGDEKEGDEQNEGRKRKEKFVGSAVQLLS